MAELLKGATLSHAPLSQAQTLSIFQYLQEGGAGTNRELQDLKTAFDEAENANSADRREQFVLVGTVNTLQKELAEACDQIQTLQKLVSNCMRQIRWLEGEYQKQAENITMLREGQKVTNTNVHCLKNDLSAKAEDIKELQQAVDEIQTVGQANAVMRLDNLENSMRQLSEDNGLNKCGLSDQRLLLQGFDQQLKSHKREITAMHEKVVGNTKKVDDTAQKTEGVKTNLELTNGVVMKLHSDQEMADKNIRDLKTDSHHLHSRLEKGLEDLAGTGKTLHETRENLMNTSAESGTTREMLLQAVERVKALQDDHSLSRTAIDNLGKNLESVQNLACVTKEDLKLTNAFVLPNLGADGAVSATSVLGGTANSGYVSLGSTGRSTESTRLPGRNYRSGPSSPVRSPRVKKREASWYARNIGNVPDRMAMI